MPSKIRFPSDYPVLVDENGADALTASSEGVRAKLLDDGGRATDVRMFRDGMGVNNVTADTEGWKLALAEAGGTSLQVSGGYRIGETLIVGKGNKIISDGRQNTVLSWEGAAAAPIMQAGAADGSFQSNIMIEGLSFRNLDGTATWALRLNKSSFENVYRNIVVAVTAFVEGGIDITAGSIVNTLEHLWIEHQPIALRTGPNTNGLWLKGGQLLENVVGIYLPSESSTTVIEGYNFEDHSSYAIHAINQRGLEIRGCRFEENYFDASDPASTQVLLEGCKGVMDGGYITGDLSNAAIRPNYAVRFIGSGPFMIYGLSERAHATQSIGADAASRGQVRVHSWDLGTAIDGQNVMREGLAMAAVVERVAVQTIPTSSSQDISFDTETLDKCFAWAAGTPTRIFANFPGVYRLRCDATFTASNTGYRQLQIRKLDAAGTDTGSIAFSRHTTPGAAEPVWMDVEAIAELAAGESLLVRAFQNAGGNLDLTARAQFERIGQ